MSSNYSFRGIMKVASLLAAVLLGAVGRLHAGAPPNVVLIMADDLGYETLGANDGTSYRTPSLDKLAAQGVRFERCYVQPHCTPTRVQLMTGIYNVRNYINFGHMDPTATTFGNLFQKAGYATCIAGKWQLGADLALPQKFGFDEYCLWQHTRRPERYRNPGLEINGVATNYSHGEYGPDIVNDYALDFLKRKRDKPFFLYYPMMLTHSPYVPTPDSPDYNSGTKRGAEGTDGINPHFADMVAYTDKLVGKILGRLDELGLRENTLVLFLGDNGTGRGTLSRMGDRAVIGGKGQTKETGMRVPLIASWPAKMRGERICGDLVDSTDFLPTICAAAGIPVPAKLKIDGRSFLPQICGQKSQLREWIYCWYSSEGILAEVRECAFDQRFKLYRSGEFFDLSKDIDEKQPLSVDSLTGAALSASKQFQAAMERYRDARPAALKALTRTKGKKGSDE